MGERMFEVTRYEPPEIFVTSRRTGETYKFSVGIDGAVIDEVLFDERDARRAAILYLAQRARANVVLSKT
jgi:polygalacturonase